MSDADTARYYLSDLGHLLRDEALDAKREYEEAKRSTDDRKHTEVATSWPSTT